MKQRTAKKLGKNDKESIKHYQGKSFQENTIFYSKPEELLKAVKLDYRNIYSASTECLGNKQVMMEVISKDAYLYRKCSKQLKKDDDIMFQALKQNPMIVYDFPQDLLLKRRDIALAVVNGKGRCLQFLPLQYSQDPEFVYIACQQDATAFEYADPRIRSDRDFVLRICKISAFGLKSASYAIKNDPEFVTKCIMFHGEALAYATIHVRGVREICLLAIKQNPASYKWVSGPLKLDKELYMMSRRMYFPFLHQKICNMSDSFFKFE